MSSPKANILLFYLCCFLFDVCVQRGYSVEVRCEETNAVGDDAVGNGAVLYSWK